MGQLALLCTAGGLVAGLLVLLRTGAFPIALKVGLEFWTAAGLLRLSQSGTWRAIGAAAAIVAVRQLIGYGLRSSVRAVRPG